MPRYKLGARQTSRAPSLFASFSPKADCRITNLLETAKGILCETARHSEDWLQNHPAVRDERHEEAQHAAQDHGRDLAVLDVHPDEHEALDCQDSGRQNRQLWLPMERGGKDEPDRAHELQDAQGHPGFPRQRPKGWDVLAYLVEHKDLHDARRSVQERGEDLQDPQQYVHRVPLGRRITALPNGIQILIDLYAAANNEGGAMG